MSFDRSIWRFFDIWLMLGVLMLCGLGIAMTYSATITTVDLTELWIRQLQFVGLGLLLMVIVAAVDYRNLELLAQPAYAAILLILLLVYFFGVTQGGARRWLDVGFTIVQPAEFGKFALLIFFAWYFSRFQEQLNNITYLFVAVALLLIPLALIYLQPDLGMAISWAFIGGSMILISGIRLWQLFVVGGLGLATLPFLWGTLQGYMVERITIFLSPESNPQAAFNVDQALISVGNGGWMGMGWANGSQNQLRFLRVRHTDFVFSVISEELGFVGAVLVLLLLFFVIWRIITIADRAQDQFGRLIAVGVAALIFFQTFINVGMNLSLVPVTGLTLPFVSYGGSSMVSMMLAIGLAQSVAMRHQKMDFIY